LGFLLVLFPFLLYYVLFYFILLHSNGDSNKIWNLWSKDPKTLTYGLDLNLLKIFELAINDLFIYFRNYRPKQAIGTPKASLVTKGWSDFSPAHQWVWTHNVF
jgi:hypothetical protein